MKLGLFVCSPDESGKPFEIELLTFPKNKERPAEAPLFLGKGNCMKKLETASRKQLQKQIEIEAKKNSQVTLGVLSIHYFRLLNQFQHQSSLILNKQQTNQFVLHYRYDLPR